MADSAIYGTHTIRDLRGAVLMVRLSRQFRVRVWLSVQLIKAAAWLLYSQCEIDYE